MTDLEMQEYFPKVYPKIFQGRYGGIDCDAGWFNILNLLCQNIQSHIDWTIKQGKPVDQVVVAQVKEKFGTLRFYYNGGDQYIQGLVSMAEDISAVTCEKCGSVGMLRHGGWVKTLCDTHEEERQSRLKERMNNG
jgi:hypothetical protein